MFATLAGPMAELCCRRRQRRPSLSGSRRALIEDESMVKSRRSKARCVPPHCAVSASWWKSTQKRPCRSDAGGWCRRTTEVLKSEDYRGIKGAQKAAILMLALGEEQCTRLLQ